MKTDIQTQEWVKVWDPFVRVFHWTLLVLFCSAYYTAEWGQNETHLLVGYGLAVLIPLRLVWGFVGGHHARFRNFWYGHRHLLDYARSLGNDEPLHYVGHNPLGAAMVYTLLALLMAMVVTGLILTAGLEYEGPLLGFNSWFNDEQIYQILTIHRVTMYLLLGCVALHVGGVVLSSRLHRENLVLAMIHGKKPRHSKYAVPLDSSNLNPSKKQGTTQ